MKDADIIEISQNLYGGHLSEHVLHTHKTVEFARRIEKQVREECISLIREVLHDQSPSGMLAAVIRKGEVR